MNHQGGYIKLHCFVHSFNYLKRMRINHRTHKKKKRMQLTQKRLNSNRRRYSMVISTRFYSHFSNNFIFSNRFLNCHYLSCLSILRILKMTYESKTIWNFSQSSLHVPNQKKTIETNNKNMLLHFVCSTLRLNQFFFLFHIFFPHLLEHKKMPVFWFESMFWKKGVMRSPRMCFLYRFSNHIWIWSEWKLKAATRYGKIS